MIVLKIIGITLGVILALLILALALNIKLILGFTKDSEPKFLVKVLCFTFGKRKKPKTEQQVSKEPKEPKKAKEKKPNKFLEKLKKKFGLDFLGSEDFKQNVDEAGISGVVSKVVAIVTMLAGQLKWLLAKFRLDKLKIIAVCSGGDAADAAMDYGLVCASVYPLVGYLTANINKKKDAEEVAIGCDFDGNSYFDFELIVSVRTIHIVRALIRSMSDMAEIAENMEANNEQQRK